MNVSHGMNVAEIEHLGRSLQTGHAVRIRDLVTEVERLVGSTSGTWVGPDAERFRSWWPNKRSRLLGMADDLEGFGQSALNNVSEQRQASGESAGTSGGSMTGGVATIGGGQTSTGRNSSSTPGAGSYSEHFNGKGNAFLAEWKPNASGYDQWNFAYDGDGDSQMGNCTSFVAWRLNQLGESAGIDDYSFTNNHLTMNGETVDFGRLGNANEWLGNASAAGVDPVSSPQAGDVAVFTGGNYGHVAVVKEVLPNGSVVVEESAWDRYTYQARTISASDASGYLRMLP